MVLKEDQRRADSTYWQAHYKLDKWMRKSTGTSGPGEVRTNAVSRRVPAS